MGCAVGPNSAKSLTHLINLLEFGKMSGRKRPVTESADAVLDPAMRQSRMKSTTLAAAVAVFVPMLSGAAFAGPIERACMASDRGGSRSLCGCIQQAADQTLSGGDQRRAAKFFKDPEAAHSTWVSQSASDDAFWERYKSFGQTAEATCAG
jgi:hypothetical protein